MEPSQLLGRYGPCETKLSNELFWFWIAEEMTAKKKSALRSSGEKITPETRRIIAEAFDKQMSSIGFPPLNTARDTLREVFQKGPSNAEPGTVLRLTAMVTLLDYIENTPEPTPEALKEALKKLGSFPFEFRAMLDGAVKSIKRKLPHKPGGGRPSDLTQDQKKAACSKVGMLIAQGVSLQDAQTRVASSFGVGRRTIQRAWQKRAELHKLAD